MHKVGVCQYGEDYTLRGKHSTRRKGVRQGILAGPQIAVRVWAVLSQKMRAEHPSAVVGCLVKVLIC